MRVLKTWKDPKGAPAGHASARRALALLGAATALLGAAATARAGGFELPDNGTEALGRGGAFVAKADDGTALEYNIAGLARQRGTRVTLDANLLFHDVAFTRAGVYPGDPSDMRTPYAGQPYPTIHDKEGLFPAPFLGISTDFGWFRRWTFGLGVYGPSAPGKHNYGVGDPTSGSADDPPAQVKLASGMTAPAPSRYDIGKTDLIIAYPTLAVGVSPLRWLDVGVALQLVYSHFDLSNANVTSLGSSFCPTRDYAGCDSYGRIKTSGLGFGFLVSLLAHPTDFIDVGVTYKGPADVNTSGTLHAVPPPANPTKLPDLDVTFTSKVPMSLRLGGRAVSRYADGTERADLELDLVWENWSAEVADHIHADNFILGAGGQLNADVVHNYRDTYGARLGGAYNHRLGELARLTGRLGFYFDSAASRYPFTRLDFNTAAKYGFTVGAGVKWKGLMLNIAYAFIYSPTRTVENSEVTAISSTNGTAYQKTDYPLITVANGRYEPMTQILSIGLTVNFGEFHRATLLPN